MAAPGIELRWGSGFEDKDDREAVRGMLKSAKEAAIEGLGTLGLLVDTPKYMKIYDSAPSRLR